MNTDRLVTLLGKLTPRTKDHESLATYNPESTQYRLTRKTAVKAEPVVDELAAVLAEEPELHVFDGTPLRTTPTSSWGGQFFHLARWMLAQTRQRDAAEVVHQLEEFIATNAVDALEVMPLWGLHPAREIVLVDDIRLTPLAEVPPTVTKDMLTGVRSSRYEDKNFFAWAPRPKAALVRSFRHGPIFNPAGNDDHQWIEKLQGGADVKGDRMLEIARVLTLVCPSPVFPIGHWFQFSEETPLIAGLGGAAGFEYYTRFVEELPPEDYDNVSVQRLVSEYETLSPDLRRKLDVPLERLRLSLLRVRPNDIALELGIALESLLTQERQPDAPISYTVRLRATHLLGGGPEARRENVKRFRVAYHLRNVAAHGGTVDDRALREAGGEGSVAEYLAECVNRSAKLVRRIINDGGFPDWEGLAMGWVERLS